MSSLTGIYFLTGGSRGVGRALCSTLLDRGAKVINLSRTRPDINHSSLVHIEGDLGDKNGIMACGETLLEALGDRGLDGFIANAGVTNPAPLEESDMDQWRATFEVNVFGHVDLLRLSLPELRKNRGRVVFVSSVGGIVSSPLLSSYCASKHAVEGVANSIRTELAHTGVKVSVIQPAAMPTEILRLTPDQIINSTGIDGPYREMATKVSALMTSGYEKRASPPDKAVNAILHALTSKNPRHHYPIGQEAWTHSLLTRRLPSRTREWLMKKVL
jgi:NAD(P)-dependent dehydrogenase (short-subunit alcohol dehydrogenase family)